jgi:hypothetical protein
LQKVVTHDASVGELEIKVFDILGRDIETLVNGYKTSGKYNVVFNGKTFSSGVYFYTLTAGNFVCSKKFILLK